MNAGFDGVDLTGTYQSVHQVLDSFDETNEFSVLDEGLVTIAEVFRDAGFKTAAVSLHQGWVSPKIGFGQGFDEFTFVSSINDRHETEKVVTHGLDWLAAHRADRFFIFLNILNPHDPYEAPPTLRSALVAEAGSAAVPENRLFDWQVKTEFLLSLAGPGPNHATPEELDYVIASYDAEISYVDWWIGVLVRQLQSWNLLEHLDRLDLGSWRGILGARSLPPYPAGLQ